MKPKRKKTKEKKESREKKEMEKWALEIMGIQTDVKTFIEKFRKEVAQKRRQYRSSHPASPS